MSNFQNFSSLPPDQEATFIVYEERAAEATKKGLTIGVIAAIVTGVLIIGARLVAEPDRHNPMEEPSAKPQTQQAAPKPAAAATPTPAPTTPAEAPATDPAAPAATDPAAPATDPAAGSAAPAPTTP